MLKLDVGKDKLWKVLCWPSKNRMTQVSCLQEQKKDVITTSGLVPVSPFKKLNINRLSVLSRLILGKMCGLGPTKLF